MLEKKQRQIAQTLRWQVKYIPTLFQHGLEKTNRLETVKQLRSVDKLFSSMREAYLINCF